MPTHDPSRALGPGSARALVAEATSGRTGGTGLGLEVELFPLICHPTIRRLPIGGRGGTVERLAAATSGEVWSFALQGAARLPAGSFGPDDLALTERFLERFTLRGRSPADELATVLATAGKLAALRWAAEPVTSGAGADSSASPPVRRR